MRFMIWICTAAGMVTALDAMPPVLAGDDGLVLEARLYSTEVVERIPLIARLTIRNIGTRSVNTHFPPNQPRTVDNYSTLVLRTDDGVYRLSYVAGPQANTTAPPAQFSLAPDSSIVVERVISLIARTPVQQWSGAHNDRYTFLGPGNYTGHFEVVVAPARKLVSNTFELAILEAQPADQSARNRIALRHVDFLEGHDPPADQAPYDGRKWYQKVDVSRFGELQEILDDFPDSTYAQWIRFWKLYHHGPVDDAIDYARNHRDFPLSDNLLLRVAENLFHQAGKNDRATFDRVRQLSTELLRDFPGTDTSARVQALQQKLTRKP